MRDNCAAGRSTWTNNNCESINHVLKQTVQWRRNQLPDLIDKLCTLVDGQYADADRALCGRGDYVLCQEWAKHRVTVDYWSAMSTAQWRKAVEACFRLPGVSTATSSDGSITEPTTPGGGKKPHQRKRSKIDRTTSIKPKAAKKVKMDCDVEPDTDSDFE